MLHHEMGHIQYYMAYENQPALFRQANTAFHESIGDAIMYGAFTPQHLHRLGLINDSLLYKTDTKPQAKEVNQNSSKEAKHRDLHKEFDEFYNAKEKHHVFMDDNYINSREDNLFENTDDILMLKQALIKIPQIPFSLLIDEYRWKYFEGDISSGDVNKMFWEMAMELQGIAPNGKRGEEYFDIGAKFHVPDNTPYIR